MLLLYTVYILWWGIKPQWQITWVISSSYIHINASIVKQRLHSHAQIYKHDYRKQHKHSWNFSLITLLDAWQNFDVMDADKHDTIFEYSCPQRIPGVNQVHHFHILHGILYWIINFTKNEHRWHINICD
jgi:hypothetical protein